VAPGHAPAAGPPPLPPQATFHVAVGGSAAGPFDPDALAALVKDGKLVRKTLVWKPGMANWVAADTVPEIQPLLANVPPPLPT
jgi:hypothetical protein